MHKEPKFLNDGDKWILAEDIPDIDFQFSQIWLSSFVNDLEKTIGINYKKVLTIYDNGYNLKFYYGDKDSEHVSQVILDKIVSENFGKNINKGIRESSDKLLDITNRITPEFLETLSNSEFLDFYKQLDEVHTECYTWGWLSNAVDMFHTHFTNHLKDILRKYLNDEAEINKALVALSFWEEKSFIQEEHESLIKLAILKKENSPLFEHELQKHFDNFFYLKHLWTGKEGVSTKDEYLKSINDLLESNPQIMLEAEEKRWQEDKIKKEACEQNLNLINSEKELFEVYAEFAYTKSYRRKIQLLWAYKMDFIFNELVKRLDVSFIESRFMLPEEVEISLIQGMNEDLKKIITERTKHCVYYAEKDLDIVVIGEDCKKYEATILEENVDGITEVKGQIACIGKVTGVVRIVNSVEDISKVNEGDILVSIATNPDVLPAMKKAVAFVTEQGGITSHAAIVARELNKPCVIGTKIATKVFKDGDLVEVDAEKGIVRKIN